MKNLHIISILVLCISFTYGQPTNGFSYQTVARNASGSIIANSEISLRISILKGSTTGNPVCTEIFTEKTNSNGLINIIIGSKAPLSFDAIDWSKGPYFLNVELDEKGGSNFSFIGTSQLLSVPYAIHAKIAEKTNEKDPVFLAWDKSNGIQIKENQIIDLKHFNNLDEKDPIFSNSAAASIKASDITNWNLRTETDPIFIKSIAYGITVNDISKWNNKSDFDGKYSSLYEIPNFQQVAFSGNYNDLTNTPANIVYLKQTPNKGDILYFTGDQWITLPIGKEGQVLTIDITGNPSWK